jgi:hypothetical protein
MGAAIDAARIVPRRPSPIDGRWPLSERARWLPALAMAIGIIYGEEEDGGRSAAIRNRAASDD